MARHPDPDQSEGFRFQLFLDGKPLAPPEGVISLMESILQDQGEIPPEDLVAAGPGLDVALAAGGPGTGLRMVVCQVGDRASEKQVLGRVQEAVAGRLRTLG